MILLTKWYSMRIKHWILAIDIYHKITSNSSSKWCLFSLPQVKYTSLNLSHLLNTLNNLFKVKCIMCLVWTHFFTDKLCTISHFYEMVFFTKNNFGTILLLFVTESKFRKSIHNGSCSSLFILYFCKSLLSPHLR